MADLKPLGSEKLQGDDKLKRILELTYYGNKSKSTSSAKAEYVTESVNGVYGIVKEKDGYYVKKGLNESSLDYIGGLFMKNKNRFNSYAEAFKRLDLLNGQELNEATKYVLKQKTSGPSDEAIEPSPVADMPAEPAPMPEPSAEVPSDMPAEEPMMEPSPEEMPSDEMGGEAKPSDYMAEIQKFAGKLGQELRDQKQKMESDDIKYVLNMIISAVDLTKLEDEDIEEIAKKFERDEEEMGGEEVPSEEPEMPAEEPEMGDEELGEMSMMDKLESFVNMPAVQDEEINLKHYADLSSVQEDEVKEVDLEEIKKEINKSIEETLGKYFK
jgi:hypothetical protein